MKTTQRVFARTAIAVALSAIFAPAMAQQSSPGVNAPTDNNVRLGVGIASGDQYDRTIFGQYNGLRNSSTNLLLDFDYRRYNEQTGMASIVRGRNLGLDDREASFTTKKLGDWRFTVDYGEIVHHEIRTVNTAEGGIGTTTPNVNVLPVRGTGSNVDLSLKRTALGLSGDKWLSSNLQFEVSFKNEDKKGARFWGRGYDCAATVCTNTQNSTNTKWATLFLAEPLDRNTKQIDARLNYTSGKLVLSGGYYGSFYSNSNGSVTPTVPNQLIGPGGGLVTLNPAAAGGMSLQNVLQSPMALPPDNQAHQLYVAGNYAFTPSTQSTFKLSYTHASQTEDFSSQGLTGAPAGRSNLGGQYDTKLVQVGLTSHPIAKLGINANLRYEDREDQTPIDFYNKEGALLFTNGENSLKKINGKLEATYPLILATRGTVGLDYESIDRGTFTPTVALAGITGIRQKNEEIGYRVELRRAMAETVTGSVSYRHSTRDGSTWLKPNAGTGVTELSDTAIFNRTGIFPYSMTNRERDQVKAAAEWMPMDRLSLQFVAQGSRDHYTAPSEKGTLEGGARLYSLDVAYQVDQNWKLTAYASTGDTRSVNASSSAYIADINERNTAIGIGMAGKLTSRVQAGINTSVIKDRTHYGLGADRLATPANVNQAAIGVPDVQYREGRVNLFANYALQKNSDVRLDLTHVAYFMDEWAWQGVGVPYNYSDNTTVSFVNRDQKVTFVAASYIYRF